MGYDTNVTVKDCLLLVNNIVNFVYMQDKNKLQIKQNKLTRNHGVLIKLVWKDFHELV